MDRDPPTPGVLPNPPGRKGEGLREGPVVSEGLAVGVGGVVTAEGDRDVTRGDAGEVPQRTLVPDPVSVPASDSSVEEVGEEGGAREEGGVSSNTRLDWDHSRRSVRPGTSSFTNSNLP